MELVGKHGGGEARRAAEQHATRFKGTLLGKLLQHFGKELFGALLAFKLEVKEELGLELDRFEYGGTYWFADHEQLMHGFIGFTRKKDFVLSSEVNEAEWVPTSEALSKLFPARPGNTLQPLFHKYG